MSRRYSTPDVFSAIAHPLRRRILILLRKNGPMPAGAIVKSLPIQWGTVSQHLLVLRLAQLVTVRRRGTQLHYSLNPAKLKKAMAFFESMQPDRARA